MNPITKNITSLFMIPDSGVTAIAQPVSVAPGTNAQTDVMLREVEKPTTKALHRASRVSVISKGIERYYQKRNTEALLRLAAAERVVTDEHREALDGRHFLHLPGFVNFTGSPDYLRCFAKAASEGLTVVCVSPNPEAVHENGYLRLGGLEAVYHEIWTAEIPTIILRIADLIERQGVPPKGFVVKGPSKGGLLTWALKALSRHFFTKPGEGRKEKEIGYFDDRILHRFPGLSKMTYNHSEALWMVMEAMENSIFLPLASPLYGLNDDMLNLAKSTRFDYVFNRTSEAFNPMYLEDLFMAFGSGYYPHDMVDGVIYAKTSERDKRGGFFDLFSLSGARALLRNPMQKGTHASFEGLRKFSEEESDSLVPLEQAGRFSEHKRLIVTANHLAAVETIEMARLTLDFLAQLIRAKEAA